MKKQMNFGAVAVTILAAFLRFYRLDVLPPGLFGDEALVTLHARNAVANGNYPIYFAQIDGGFHPAIVYFTMIARWLTGNHPYAVRFGVALIGVISIPLVFLSLREIFRLGYSETQSAVGALFGALVLAITFPSILVSRLGFEVMLPTPAGALTFLFLARGLRSGRYLRFALAGGALGLSLYTYYSARLLPVAIVLTVAWVALLTGREALKRNLIGLAVVTVCSAVVFAPLGFYFIQNPAIFLTRAADTSAQTLGQGGLALNLLNSFLRTFASLSLNGFGDFIPRHNIPWRAVYDIFLSVLFWLGTFVLVSRWRSRSSALLLAWAGVMLLPVILTMEKNSPHFTRMQGALPALAGICAVGGLKLFEVIARRNRVAALAVLGTGLTFSLAVSTNDYFVRWANDPALFDAFQVGDWRAAKFVLERSESQIVFLSPELLANPAHASFDLLLKDSSARHFPGPDCLAYFDRPARPLTFVIDWLNDKRTFDRVHALFPAGREGETIYHPVDLWPLYQIFEVPAGAAATPPSHAVSAGFGGEIKLLGFEFNPQSPRPGESVTLTLYWQAMHALDADYSAFVHLYPVQDLNTPMAQTDGPPCNGRYTTSRWEAGEIVIDERTVIVPPDFVDSTVTIAVGLYAWPSLERLAVTDSAWALPDNRLLLAEIQITR